MTKINTLYFLVLAIMADSLLLDAYPVTNTIESDLIGGCTGTRFGCCHNTSTACLDSHCTNCNLTNTIDSDLIGGCTGTLFGCCHNSSTTCVDSYCTNCHNISVI